MSDPSDNDLIESYLLGKMTDADKWRFETRLGDDREFARKFRLIKTFPEMMSAQGRIEYEKNRAEVTAQAVRKRTLRLPRPRYLAWAAGSLLFVLGVALFFIFKGTGPEDRNAGRKEEVIYKSHSVNRAVAPVKDTASVKPQMRPERKEIAESGGNAVQKTISLLSPADGMTVPRKEVILFNWTQKTDSFTRFYIFSELNGQVVLWRGITPGKREYKVPGLYLLPGKYYWYVGSKEEMHTFTVIE